MSHLHLLFGAAVVLAGPVAAANGPYAAVNGGVSMLHNSRYVIENAPFPGLSIREHNLSENGWGASAAVGYKWRLLRVEAEAGFTRNDLGAYVVDEPAPLARTIPQDGRHKATRLMVNAYVEVPVGRVTPYIGAGVGRAHIHARIVAPRAPFPLETPLKLIDDSDNRSAYQLIAGAAVTVAPHVALTGQYRWFDAGKFHVKDTRGEPVTGDHRGGNIEVGLRYLF